MGEILMDLSGVTLGPIIESIVQDFSKDLDIRYQLISLAMSHGHELLSRQEVADDYPETLDEIPSKVWNREKIIGSLELIRMMRDRLRGSNIDLVNALSVYLLQAMWLEAPMFVEAVENLISALEEAAYWYNIQLIAGLIHNQGIRCNTFAFIPREMGGYEVSKQCGQIDSFAYQRANGLVNGKCNAALKALLSIEADPELKKLFSLTTDQQLALAANRMGLKADLSLFENPTKDTGDEDTVSPAPEESLGSLLCGSPLLLVISGPAIWIPVK